MKSDVKKTADTTAGRLRTEWAGRYMPVLGQVRQRFLKEKPLKGVRLAACLHITSETANLAQTLAAGGAEVALCASNPLSTNDEVAAALAEMDGMSVFGIKGEDNETYYGHINATIDMKPVITMDDGADLVSMLHGERKDDAARVTGGTEETTTGVIRLRSLAGQGLLRYPIIAVNDAQTKHFFDNRYGTGQSTIDGILRSTNLLLAGASFVVCGYGWCGRGVAMRARGMGSNVIVCEVDPLRALEAVMDGYRVMSLDEAAAVGDVFVTVTGDCKVLAGPHFERMKDGAIIANSGHFNVEIDIPALEKASKSKRTVRPFVEEYEMKDGRRLHLLGEGRLINLAAAEGHPASVMDMSFANQALSAEYLVREAKKLEKAVHGVPQEIDSRIARIKLETMGISIDQLTAEQEEYLSSWESGT